VADIEISLENGLKIGETTHKLAVLRGMSVGDMLDAETASERAVLVPSGNYVLISSPALLTLESLRRQISKIGDYPGPLTMEEMRMLSTADMNLLINASEGLDEATTEAVTERGRTPASPE